jgi:transcriptional regulator with XRE-family HTH domain
MPSSQDPHRQIAFGNYLRQQREAKGLSLRDVEEKTDKQVSNAYLSQVENGKVAQPSPSILHALSPVLGVPYEKLMTEAGYLGQKRNSAPSRRTAQAATYAIDGLTPEEQRAVLAYLQVLRRQQKA